ncbi:MAG: cellobiose transport system permease protein [Clostridiales bacterium]|jgi:multiple sugar transport system permease protein|nr:cellobiose transport system permease protein [Clostridiales bacterium]
MYNKKRALYGISFIAPFFIVFAVFNLYPILYSLYLSFTDWDGMNLPSFIGLRNYSRLITDTYFYTSIFNTLFIWICSIIPQISLALFLAIILNQKAVKGRDFFRAVYFFPNIVTPVTIGVIFSLLFDWQTGTVNKMLLALGIIDENINWMYSPFFSRLIIGLAICWQWFGYNMLMFMAGLQSISQEIYEAAYIDGANQRQIAFKITLPLIKPVIIFVLITSIIGGLQIFDVPAMFRNAPQDLIRTMVMYLYETGFTRYHFGYASAIAYAIFIIIAVFSLISLKITNANKES